MVRHELKVLVSIHLRMLHFLAFFILLSLYSHLPPHLDLLFLLYLLSFSRHEISLLNLFLSLNLFLFSVGITHEMVNAAPSPKFHANITINLIIERVRGIPLLMVWEAADLGTFLCISSQSKGP